MAEPVYVIGAGRTDFKRNFKKEGKTIRHIILEAAQSAIAEAGINPEISRQGWSEILPAACSPGSFIWARS